jgi:hypothetical protein
MKTIGKAFFDLTELCQESRKDYIFKFRIASTLKNVEKKAVEAISLKIKNHFFRVTKCFVALTREIKIINIIYIYI